MIGEILIIVGLCLILLSLILSIIHKEQEK